MSKSCPICKQSSSEMVYCKAGVPTFQNVVFSEFKDACNVPRGDMELYFCSHCTFLWNAAFDASLVGYDENYENDQTHSPFFTKHVENVITHIKRGSVDLDSSRRYLEIGCGNGAFLKLLSSAVKPSSCVGFDASLGENFSFQNLDIYNRYYSENDPGEFDVVVSRHVIEHIATPDSFLRLIINKNPKSTVFTETPRLEWIIEKFAFFDFFYEHCSYFSEASILKLFQQLGFKDVDVSKVFCDQYMLVKSCVNNKKSQNEFDSKQISLDMVKKFFINFQEFKNQISQYIQNFLQAQKNVYLWGAGAKGMTLCNNIDPKRAKIKGLVDINPEKQNKFISGSGHRVICPVQLQYDKGDKIVLVMNQNYFDEIVKTFQMANTEFISIEDIIGDVN